MVLIKPLQNFKEKIAVLNKSKLKVDVRNEPDTFTIKRRIARHMPNLPVEDLDTFLSIYRNYNYTCAWYPNILDIHIQSEYWQIFYNTNLTYNMYGAYLDKRPLTAGNKVLIRILTIIDLISENSSDYPTAYCQIWFRQQFRPVIVPVIQTQFIWNYKWGHDPQFSFPHILTCALPRAYKKWEPKSVSVVAAPCNKATNILRVIYKPLKPLMKKKEFAVCIKGLDYLYSDISNRLVEYIEALRVLGVEKITAYDIGTHENVTKVLNYYQRTGFLEYRPFNFALKYSNLPDSRHYQRKLRLDAFILHESIIYNDCIYRNMYKFKYVAVVDIDELIVPLKNYKNWHDLIDLSKKAKNPNCTNYASLCFYCAYFPNYEQNYTFSSEYPDYFYMLQHVKRAKDRAVYGYATKCLHNTEQVIATHNHFPIHYAADCRDYTFNKEDAQINHYRDPPLKENLINPVDDKGLWRFGDKIVKKSLEIFEELNFFEIL